MRQNDDEPVDYDAKGYKRNPNLQALGTVFQFTKEQLTEYLKCADDPIYFAENYIRIVNVDQGVMPFEMWDFQKEMIRKYHENRYVICKCPRQVGKTTTSVAYLLHYILFNEDVNVAILANKATTAREILHRLKFAFEMLPKFLQQGIVTWNKGSIHLANGSRIFAESTSADSIRGWSFNIIFLDEFAHVLPHVAEEFFTSTFPTISSGKSTKCIIVSTPKGMNKFYDMWADAEEEKNEYKTVSVHWSEVPGRDEAFKDSYIKNTSQEQWNQEMECDFLGSSMTLISAKYLMEMRGKLKPPVRVDGALRIYEEPVKGRTYAIACDPSQGQGADYSAFNVIDITVQPYRQVAVFRDNRVGSMLFPAPIVNCAYAYNDAFVLVEVNDIGAQVADIIHHDYGYDNLIKTISQGSGTKGGQRVSGGFTKRVQYGVRTTKQVKRIGCANLKALIERYKLEIVDRETYNEFLTFVATKESFAAEEGSGKHDDVVMSLVLFSWLAAQKYFKETVDIDIRKVIEAEQLQMVDNVIAPFGVIPHPWEESFVTVDPVTGERDIWHEVRQTGMF